MTHIDPYSLDVINQIALQVDSTTVDAEDRARGIPNYLTQVVISPDGRKAWVPSKKDNILRGQYREGRALTHDSAVRTIVSQLDLSRSEELFEQQIDFNDRDSAHALAFSPLGDYVFVALQGSNSVEIVDAYSGAQMGAIDNTGFAPQGVWIDEALKRAFVYNFTGRSVSIYDITDTLDSTSFAPPLITFVNTVQYESLTREELQGLQIFYNARDTRMSRDGYISCASCHLSGKEDGTIWDFTDRGEGLRNTITLKGRKGTGHGKVHWTANFDEIQDFENDIRNAFGGTGFLTDADFAETANPLGAEKAGRSPELDALAAYVASLDQVERSPHRSGDGYLTEVAQTGQTLFSEVGCDSCHSGANFTDGQRHDVGTIDSSSGLGSWEGLVGVGFDTPTLLGAWRTAPYFHNGQAATLEDVVNSGHGANRILNSTEKTAVTAYVKSLDTTSVAKTYIQIKQIAENRCWSVNAAPGAEVKRLPCADTPEQWWYEDLYGRFHPKGDENLCVQARPDFGSRLKLATCSNSMEQRWQTDGRVIRSQVDLAFVVDAFDNQPETIGIWSHHGSSNQQWLKVESTSDLQFFQFRNGRYGCLTATGLNQDDNVVVNDCSGSDFQQWSLSGNGILKLKADPSYCLDYKGEAFSNGRVVIEQCNGTDNQTFDYLSNRLKTRINGNYTVDAFGNNPGDNVGIWYTNTGSNQVWYME